MADAAFKPLQKENLGKAVADALLDVDARPLGDTESLFGAGVYAIYYSGPSPFYGEVAILNGDAAVQPIYVGKAIPKGGRKGGVSFDATLGGALRERLRNHGKSIEEASNLELADFVFRALVVDDIWIPLGENVLIERYRPVWNRVIDGYGNKDPGNRRATQYCSAWDTLHPGRKFAEKLAPNPRPVSELEESLRQFYERGVTPLTTEEAMIAEEGDTPPPDPLA